MIFFSEKNKFDDSEKIWRNIVPISSERASEILSSGFEQSYIVGIFSENKKIVTLKS